jgi:aminodeoxyfutalosine deaminase
MRYQKFKGTGLFTGRELLPGSQVLITSADGTIEDIVPATEAGDDIQVVNGLLCPGFINAHCHLELSHLRGAIPTGTGLIPFLQAVPKLRQYPPEEIQAAMAQAAESMYQNGIVAVGDICNTADSLSIKQQSPLHWHNFIETIGFSNDKAAERFAWSKAIYDQFESRHPGKNTMVPHAPYSVSEKLFGLLNQASAGRISSIHSQESEAENEWYRTKTGPLEQLYQGMGIDTDFFQPSGKSSLQTVWPWMDRVKHLLLVHNVTITSDECRMTPCLPRYSGCQGLGGALRQIANSGASTAMDNPSHSTFNFQLSTFNYFILCPLANQYIQQTLPPVNLLRQHGCTIALGTDSLASNHQLSIWAEIQALQTAFPDIPLAEMLQWATLNGAMALGMADTLGSFEKGKRPGVVCIEEDKSKRIG